MTDSNGCSAEETLTLQVLGNPSSVLSSDAENNSICFGDTVSFTNVSDSISEHAFFLQGLLEQQDSLNNWSTAFISDGDSVQVRIIDNNGCSAWSNAVYMTVWPIPSTPSILDIGDSITTTSLADSYEWSYDDSSTITAENKFAKLGDGSYLLRLFDGNCWSLWSEALIITGINELGGLSIKLYPSPAKETINLRFENIGSIHQGDITVIDMQGKTVKQILNVTFSPSQEVLLNIGELSTGMYNIMLKSEDKQVTLPFVKEKQ